MTTKILSTIAIVLATAGIAGAQSDDLRCQSSQMRADSQYYRCLSRCSRRSDRIAARPVDRQTAIDPSECTASCATHRDDDLARITSTPPCTDVTPPPPNPQECEARVLQTSSLLLRCAAQCGRDHRRAGFDRDACLGSCTTRCGTDADQILASLVCSNGRVGTSDPCTLH